MTLINDVIGVGLTFGMTLTSPTCPTIEVALGENGKIVVLRQTGTGADTREQHSGRHPIHAPMTRLVVSSSTDAGSLWPVIAVTDHDHVKDAASDRMIEDIRWLSGLARYRSA
jgi:hypothetical protein